MNPSPRFLRCTLIAASLLTTSSLGAANAFWDTSTNAGFQAGDGFWGTDNFWTSDGTLLLPWVSGNVAVFQGGAASVVDTIKLASSQTVSGMTFGTATTFGDWNLAGAGLNLSANSTFTVNSGSSVVLGNVISSAFGLTKSGTGGLTLTGANTYTGTTTVSAGTLTVASGGSLGGGLLSVSTGANATLNGSSIVTNIAGAGGIAIGSGATLTLNPPSAWSFYDGQLSGAGSLVKSGVGETLMRGDSSGFTGAIALQAGTLSALNSTSSFGSGDLTISATAAIGGETGYVGYINNRIFVTAGTATFGVAGKAATLVFAKDILATGTGSIVFTSNNVSIVERDVSVAGTGALTLAKGTLQLGNGGTTGTINGGTNFNLATTGGTLAFKRSDDFTYSGVISGAAGFTQAGTGNLTLTGINTYTGATTVSAGTLTVASGGSLGSGAVSVAAGATLQLNAASTVSNLSGAGTIAVASATTLTVNPLSGWSLFNGGFSGSGTLVKSGAGETLLIGDSSAFTGAITLQGGTLSALNATSSLGSGDLTVTASATIGGETGYTGYLNNRIFVTGGTATLGVAAKWTSLVFAKDILATGTGSIVFTSNQQSIVERDVSVIGTGTLTLAKGTLQLGNGGTTGTINGGTAFNLATTGGTLAFKRSDDFTYSGVISGAAGFTQAGTGNLTLTGVNTYTGTTTVSSGTLTVATGAAIGAGNVALSGGRLVMASLDVAKMTATSGVFEGVLTGTGGLTKSGAGTVTLTGINTYTGATTVSAGTLLVHGSVGAVTVASGATVGGRGQLGAVTLSSGATVSAGASIGTLTASSMAFAGGSGMSFQLNDAGGSAGVGYDLVNVTGVVNLSTLSVANKLNLNLSTLSNPADAISGAPTVFNPTMAYRFTLMKYGSLNLGANGNVADLFNITTNGFSDQFGGVGVQPTNFTVLNDTANSRLLLAYSPVPEPSTYGLGLGFLAFAISAVRRRRKSVG